MDQANDLLDLLKDTELESSSKNSSVSLSSNQLGDTIKIPQRLIAHFCPICKVSSFKNTDIYCIKCGTYKY